MTIALLLLLLFLFFTLRGQNAKKTFIVISSVAMVLVSGLRHPSVGNDTEGTMNKFQKISHSTWSEVLISFWDKYLNPSPTGGKDPAEDIFFKVLSIFTDNSQIMLFVVAIIALTSIGIFIYKHTTSLQEVLFSYIFFITLFYQYVPNSSVRQPIALAFLLFAFSALENKKFAIFIILLFFASLFHKSALIAGLLVPLSLIKNTRSIYYMFVPVFVFVLLYYKYVGTFLMGVNEVYEGYLQSSFYISNSKPFLVIVLMVGLYIYIAYCGVPQKVNGIHDRLMYYGTGMTTALVPLIWLDPSMLRLICYFGLYMALAVGKSAENSKSSKQIMILIYLLFIVKILTSRDNYHFMWENVINYN